MRKFIDKIKPSFEKGGKFGFLHSTFDAFESFLYVPDTVTLKGSHVRDSVDLKRIMITVVVALVPCALFGIWNVGYQHNIAFDLGWGFWQMVWYGFLRVLPLYVVAYVVGLAIEFISCGRSSVDARHRSGIRSDPRQGSVRRHRHEHMEPGPAVPCIPVLLIPEQDVR